MFFFNIILKIYGTLFSKFRILEYTEGSFTLSRVFITWDGKLMDNVWLTSFKR